MTTARITGAGSAFPPVMEQSQLWSGYFAGHTGPHRRAAERIFTSSGVRRRHGVVNPVVEDVSGWGTQARMRRWITEALPLGQRAVRHALDAAGLDPTDVGLLAVATCTGYATPGLDVQLGAALGMAPDVQRLMIGHMGCYAALPGLGAVSDYVVARGHPAVLLCLELTSLHLQRDATELQQVVTHALFGDAAAAVVLQPGPGGDTQPGPGGDTQPGPGGELEVVDVAAVTDAATADHMTWDITDHGFRMGLSPRVPDVLAKHVGPLVDVLLGRNGLDVGDVRGWAVHPGGPRILDTVAAGLDLDAEAMAASRRVLAERGNCSSPTVLLVLDALTPHLAPGAPVVALAFGPGLTLYAALLRLT